MFDHVTIRVGDLGASESFYETVLGTLGHATTRSELGAEWGDFSIAPGSEEQPRSRRLHVGFVASSEAEVDAFWRAGVDAGYASDGEPGPRPQYHERYYGGFLRDPDGNSVEAVFHGRPRSPGTNIDHVWLRVADLEASTRFYATLAPVVGARIDTAGRWGVGVVGDDRSLTLLAGEPTEHAHIAFSAGDQATVEEFHRTLLAAGYRDNGGPGERPIYHPGYYGAFVLDPDGNNIEAVFHNR
jgi:catechol 2,3-dioxygenase-like lactoylglutathione lyase family enzyme